MAHEVLCPDRIHHTEVPQDYLAWHSWAKLMSKTHRQLKCAGCGRYLIWLPKQKETD